MFCVAKPKEDEDNDGGESEGASENVDPSHAGDVVVKK